jgi:hypothetical protein
VGGQSFCPGAAVCAGQTHERLEVLVVGDGPSAKAEASSATAGDPRLRWTSTTQRYVYPDEYRHWLATTTLARNEGYRLAEGRWLFDLDDDSLPADAIESLLGAARASRAEAVPLAPALLRARARRLGAWRPRRLVPRRADAACGRALELLDRVTYDYFPSSLWT